jgi:exonuclease III
MNVNFLTWNIDNNKSQLFFQDLNKQICIDKIDILVLQECFNDDHINELVDFYEIEDFLNKKGKRWVRIFLNKNSNLDFDAPTAYASNKLRCTEITTANGFKFNLIGSHLYSQAGKSKKQQLFDNNEIPKYIQEYETKQKNENSVIVGDLNYRPFDIELGQPDFLNANSDKNIIRLFEKRELGGHKYRFFYNPMWNALGDYDHSSNSSKVSGTYYWYPNDLEKYHWNLIDGVIVSPTIMDNIIVKSIKIYSEINSKQLIKSKIKKMDESILETGFSDHLPVSFTLKSN